MGDRVLQTIFMEPVTAVELIITVHSLKNGAPGYDGVPSQILKETINLWCSPRVHSLANTVFDIYQCLVKCMP